ncbi:MAG: DUF1015 family protein [Clostridiales bacterium]|jgi:uncharacterized protein (DUF1015 family)|nr:DUF1015 family protein [Clostridiales bacterium]
MAGVYSFAALRPDPEFAGKVAAPPYDVLSTEEARELAAHNPYSFLHVDKAEIDLDAGISLYSPEVYAKARENLDQLTAQKIMMRDECPFLYIYRLASPGGKAQTGLAACLSVEEYNKGIIKKHELTRPDKEQDRVDHILACEAHTGPIFCAYREKPENGVRAILSGWADTREPVYDFTHGGVRHTLWVINDSAVITAITEAFKAVPYIYIADGHHRSAAASRVAEKAGATGETERGRFLSVIFPDDELAILDYNRLVRDLNGLSTEEFINALRVSFSIEESAAPVKPSKPGEYGLYMGGVWRKLLLKEKAPSDAVEGLAVSILQREVMAKVLGISDPQRDKRIDFVGGARGTEGLAKRVDSGEMAAAFTVSPTTLEELLAVADANRIMPPKSTWFEPKLLSGLLIHSF